MRIAYFSDTFSPQINGVSNTLNQLRHFLDSRPDIDYRLIVPDFGPGAVDDDSRVIRISGVAFFLYPECRLALPNPMKIHRMLGAFEPDLIHAVTELNLGMAGMGAARKMGLPLVTTFTTNFPGYMASYGAPFLEEAGWSLMRRFHARGNLCVCPSLQTRQMLEDRGFSNVHLWGRGIDPDRFELPGDPEAVRDRYGMKGRLVLLYVGRLSLEKNLPMLLSAYETLRQSHGESIGLVLAGDGPLRGSLEKAHPKALFTGNLRGRALTELYGSSHVFAFPSATETLGNVVLEAMAAGLPVVGPAAGGIQDNIRHGVTGLLTTPGDICGFTRALDRLIRSAQLRQSMGLAAREAARAKSWDRVFAQLLGHYRRVLSETSGSGSGGRVA